MADYINNYETFVNTEVNTNNEPNLPLTESSTSNIALVSTLLTSQNNMLMLQDDKYRDVAIGDSFQTMEELVNRIYTVYMDEEKHILKKIRQRNGSGDISNLLFYCKLSKSPLSLYIYIYIPIYI